MTEDTLKIYRYVRICAHANRKTRALSTSLNQWCKCKLFTTKLMLASLLFTLKQLSLTFQWVGKWETYYNSCTNELCAICIMKQNWFYYISLSTCTTWFFFQWISTNQRLFLYNLLRKLGWNLQNKPLHTISIQ